MLIADFIAENKDALIQRWMTIAESRLALKMEVSELVNDLPNFVDDLVEALRSSAGKWPDMRGARSHGRDRMRRGIDVGALTEEMTLVGEMVLELAGEQQVTLQTDEVRRLLHVMGHGAAASVRAYAALRDREILDEAAQHYSFVAHEVRAPLQTARLTAELLFRGPETNRGRYFARLDRSLGQVAELVDNSIVHARLQGKPRLKTAKLDVTALIEGICEDVEAVAQAKGVNLTREVERLEVEADHKLLVSALTNLMRNAIKFSAEGGQVIFRATSAEGRVLFEIDDQCGGMPDELPAKLFQPFVQENANKSGFGLGLLIVKQAAEAHNGSVRVVNRPGHGCTFVLDLPLRYVEADA